VAALSVMRISPSGQGTAKLSSFPLWLLGVVAAASGCGRGCILCLVKEAALREGDAVGSARTIMIQIMMKTVKNIDETGRKARGFMSSP